MDTPFPFGLELPSALYSTLLMATFAVHLLAAQFVLGGTAVVAFSALRSPRGGGPLRELLRDWLPFLTGVTITLGVAPLLFVQIVDQEAFYSANLLLFHRWMALLPVLIVAFYLLYVQKASARLRQDGLWGRVLPAVTFVCFLFVAASWTENHLLSLERSEWTEFYRRGKLFFVTPALWPRVLTMLSLSLVGVAVVGSFVLRGRSAAERGPVREQLGRLALGGLLAGVGFGAWTGSAMGARASALAEPFGLPWLLLAGVGAVATFCASVAALRRGGSGAWLSLSWSVFLLGLAGMREVVRWAAIDPARVTPRHARAWTVGGFEVFLLFAVATAGLLVVCGRAVRRDLGA